MTESSGSGRAPSLGAWAAAVCIALATMAVYAQTARHDFLSFDDKEYVSENPHLARGLDREAVRWAFTTGYAANWHPLTWLSHALDVSLFGLDDAGPHHLANAGLHVLASLLLLAALLRLTGDLSKSAFVAGLFALHPCHVESVAWLSERKDVLSGVFWMLTLLAYAHYVERPRWTSYVAVVVSFALGLLSKPVLVTLPFVLLLLDFWPLDRLRGEGALRRRLLEKLPLLVLALGSSLVTYRVQRGAMEDLGGVALVDRLSNAIVSYAAYGVRLAWPRDLAPFYPHPQMAGQDPLTLAQVGGASLALALVTAGVALATRRGERYALTGWLWYLGTLVPMIGVVQVGRAAMADRYTYLPAIGLFLVVAWGGAALLRRAGGGRGFERVVAGAVLALCAVASHQQAALWRDDFTLFAHTVRVTDDNPMAHTLLGVAYANRGDADQAKEHLSVAASIDPRDFEARDVWGRILVREGELDAARPVLEEAADLRPRDPRVQYFLARIAVGQGDFARARLHLERALVLRPPPDVEIKTRRLLAREYERIDSVEAAAREYAAVIAVAPESAPALSRLAWIHATWEPLLQPRLAVELAARAVSLTQGRQHRHLDVLAAAYAAAGDFENAARIQSDALSGVDAASGRTRRDYESRLEGYRRGRPARYRDGL